MIHPLRLPGWLAVMWPVVFAATWEQAQRDCVDGVQECVWCLTARGAS